MVTLLPVLLFYYNQIIINKDYSTTTLRDYAIVESLMAGVDPQVVIGVIKNESRFNTNAVNKNDMKQGCDSVGLVQIRDCNHPNVSFKQATDPIFAVNFLIKNIDKCKTWWKNTCPLVSDD